MATDAICDANLKLKGKVAIVTGSSTGIGEGIAIEFSRLGASVTITGRDQDNLKKVADKCKQVSPDKKQPLVVAGDITNEDVRLQLVKETIENFGTLDILVNNAGTFSVIPLEMNVGLSHLDAMLDIHLRTPYQLTKHCIPHLIASKGSIINISSIMSTNLVFPVGLEYSVAKAALDHFTRWLAFELGPKGVRANSINPGIIPTNIFRNDILHDNQRKVLYGAAGPLPALQRVGEVDEVARVASFLASQESSFVPGAILPVDGGYLVVPQKFDMPAILASAASAEQ